MRMLARRTDRRLCELIWHLDIEPPEREIERYPARLSSYRQRV
jgi:ABC-type dipeptide/oligopeptide/nickel transport system ATPase component